MEDDAEQWVGALEGHTLRRLLGHRTLELAIASEFGYARAPRLVGASVHAVVADEDCGDIRVVLHAPDDSVLGGECSGCSRAFGPCVHMGIVAVDLAFSVALRSALLDGEPTDAPANDAPRVRRAMRLERDFDRALGDWLSPGAVARDVEIAAAPAGRAEVQLGRGYGDPASLGPTAAIALFVRRRGERKLLVPRDLTRLADFSPRDRRVLVYARDRGTGRKSLVASGSDASLALEAIRLHGGVLAAGWKRSLDFRTSRVRPFIRFDRPTTPRDASPDLFAALSASWVTDDGAASFPMGEATLFAGAFPYVWTAGGAIFPVAPDVDLDVALGLATAPVLHVPRSRLKDAGTRLFQGTRGRGIVLPTHEAFGLAPLETPRLRLQLEGEPLAFTGDLRAIYGRRDLSLLSGEAHPEAGRDLEYEDRARRVIERSGLVSSETDEDELEAEGRARMREEAGLSGVPPIVVRGERAVKFWQDGLHALRQIVDPRIDIELSPRLAQAHVGAPVTARVYVSLEGNWLRTRLDFRSEDLPVELSAVRDALLHNKRWVTLDDGTLSRISTTIESLVDEAGEVFADKPEALLAPHQLGRLDRWIEENDGRVDAATVALRRRLRTLAVAADPEMPKGLDATLRPYQRLGLAWLQFLDTLGAGGILADDMGLGKTITALAYLLWRKERDGAHPSLVVCPTSVTTNWLRESARFTPGLRVLLFHGPSRDLTRMSDYDIIVTTYAVLRRDAEALAAIPFRSAILDEAQNIKNSDSATARAAGRLEAPMRLALSGTPMENRLRELWSLASFANPGVLGTARHFEKRYERPISSEPKSPLAAELRTVIRPFLLRRTKSDVLQELPPKTEIDRMVSLSTAEKRMYDALAHTLRESVGQKLEKKRTALSLSVFTALTRLRQMACDPRLVDASLETLQTLRAAKREAFLELVRELVAEGRRALVFSQFVSLFSLWRQDLEREGIRYEYLDGSTTHREDVVARFQDGNAPLFLISLKAGGVGLNLTAADTVIHCDPWWNPAVEDQATDRAYRIGQDKPVTVVRLVARGTIEEKILSLKARKRELVKSVVTDDAGALAGLTAQDVRLLLGDADDRLSEEGDDDSAPEGARDPLTDVLATASAVVHDDYLTVVREVRRWLAETGAVADDLAAAAGIPIGFAARLALGEPFPCSRAVGERIRRHVRSANTRYQ